MSHFEPGQFGSGLTTAEITWLSAAVAAGLPSSANELQVFRVNNSGTAFEFGNSGFLVLTTISAVNGANKAFVFSTASKQPTLVVVDGTQLTQSDNKNNPQWVWDPVSQTVTLVGPPPINSIFAIQ